MDAREYLARKGLDGERDRERPNTLEEKAWSRAREAGDHRPRAGTPHDWEDWERLHDTLAEGAAALEQKIDHEAHHKALEHPEHQAAVSHFTPVAGHDVKVEGNAGTRPRLETTPAAERPAPRLALLALAVLLPPLAVGLSGGGVRRVALDVLLMLLGWLPGVIYALWWLRRR